MVRTALWIAHCTKCASPVAALHAAKPTPPLGWCNFCNDWRQWGWTRAGDNYDPRHLGLRPTNDKRGVWIQAERIRTVRGLAPEITGITKREW